MKVKRKYNLIVQQQFRNYNLITIVVDKQIMERLNFHQIMTFIDLAGKCQILNLLKMILVIKLSNFDI